MGAKFLVSFVVIFAMTVVIGFVVHGLILGADYADLPQLFRDPADKSHLPYLFAGQAFFAAAFVWIYRKGKEERPPLAQGARYGLAIAVLTAVPTYLIYFAVQPIPAALMIKQIIFEMIGIVLMGIVLAWINR